MNKSVFTIAVLAVMVLSATSCSSRYKHEELLLNGSFDSADGWILGENTMIEEGECVTVLDIPKYRTQWVEIAKQLVNVQPDTNYSLTCEARSSLPTVTSSVHFGVRDTSGNVVIDKEYLLYHDNMTPMSLHINSGNNSSLVVFCGSWANQSVTFRFDNFSLSIER